MYDRHPDAHINGGFQMDKVKNVPNIIPDIVKQIAHKIATANISNLMNIQKPIQMCSPYTIHHLIGNEHNQVDKFLTSAALCRNPIQKLQLIAAYLIAGMHHNYPLLYMQVPLDPILGETYHIESTYADFYAEKIQSSPPITMFQIISKQKHYKVDGYNHLTAKISKTLNYIDVVNHGKINIHLADGNDYTITLPDVQVNGILVGNRVINYKGFLKITNKDYFLEANFD